MYTVQHPTGPVQGDGQYTSDSYQFGMRPDATIAALKDQYCQATEIDPELRLPAHLPRPLPHVFVRVEQEFSDTLKRRLARLGTATNRQEAAALYHRVVAKVGRFVQRHDSF